MPSESEGIRGQLGALRVSAGREGPPGEVRTFPSRLGKGRSHW